MDEYTDEDDLQAILSEQRRELLLAKTLDFHIFGGSAYKCRDATCSDAHSVGLIKYRDPYPFGVDPSWRGSRSELPFLNSLKMKMSILLGVAQMNIGIILSYFNARFFSSSIDIRTKRQEW